MREVEKRERGVFEMEYSKKGEERAWDAGKVDVVERLARESEGRTKGKSSREDYDY